MSDTIWAGLGKASAILTPIGIAVTILFTLWPPGPSCSGAKISDTMLKNIGQCRLTIRPRMSEDTVIAVKAVKPFFLPPCIIWIKGLIFFDHSPRDMK
jgi:hypothetical protein